MALPFPDDTFDVAVMPLVIFSFPTQPKALPKWCGWSVQPALSQPMRGTCMEVDFLARRKFLFQ